MKAMPRNFWLLAAVALAAFSGHFLQIALFSHSLPFADQWDSEGFLLLKPWSEGQLPLQTLISTHNEHRILWKRLFDLVLFELNGGHWDNRVVALANTVFYAGALLVVANAAFGATARLARVLVLALCLTLPFTTFAYENTLWGFQSPFYQLALLGLLAFQAVADPRFSWRAATVSLALSTAALFTMASGFIVGPVCAVLVATRRTDGTREQWLKYAFVLALLCVGISGYLTMPQLDYHAPLHAQSLMELVAATLLLLSWPIPHVPLVWLPFLLWALFSTVYREAPSRTDRFFAAAALWTGVQAAALAYGRGHDMTSVPPRYTDLLIFGVVANAYFFGTLLQHGRAALRPRRPLRVFLIGVAAVTVGFAGLETAKTTLISHIKQGLWRASHESTAALLAGVPLTDDDFALAYPNRAKLVGFLADPTLRGMLGISGSALPLDCVVPPAARLSRLACALTGARSELPALQREAAAASHADGLQCSLDLLAGLPATGELDARVGVPLRFAGWAGPGAGDIRGLRRPITLRLASENAAYSIVSTLRGPRPDVAAALKQRDFAWSGFDFLISSRDVPAGLYGIELIEDGRRCTTGKHLQIR